MGEASVGDAADLLLATVAVTAAAKKKSKEEVINDAIAGQIRKRDEENEDTKAGVVPQKELVEITEDRLKSRILYCNPVCLLTTVVPRAVREKAVATAVASPSQGKDPSDEDEVKADANAATADAGSLVQLAEGGSRRNVMVLSWLTPVNNEGAFVCAVHKRRFSAECLQLRGHFALSVPVQGMEALILKVGDITGKNVDKFQLIDGLTPVELGTFSEKLASKLAAKKAKATGGANANPFAVLEGGDAAERQERALLGEDETGVSGCVSHMECRVVSMKDADDGKHHLVSAQILRAWVHPDYWNDKHFLPTTSQLPALISFAGASHFAYKRG